MEPKLAETVAAKKASAKLVKAEKKSANKYYDFTSAELVAKNPKVPPLPPFQSYRPHIQDFHDLAKKKDVAGIKEYSKKFVDEKAGDLICSATATYA